MLDFDDPRLKSRLPIAVVALALSISYWLGGGISVFAAIGGTAVVVAALLVWPLGLPDDAPPLPPALGEPPPAAPGVHKTVEAGSEGIWAPLMEGIPDPAILLSPTSMVLCANHLARQQFSIRPPVNISFAMRSPDLLAAIEEARRTQQKVSAELTFSVPVERLLTAHVTPVPVQVAIPGRNESDRSASLLLVFRDHTEERQLAQLRADFVANASHELRTPLASVKGFIETLQGAARDDAEARSRFLGIMHADASRMSRLIDDLLSLSRVEMREHLLPSGTVDLARVVDGIIHTAEPAAKLAGCRLSVDTGLRPAFVQGDRDELEQVFTNLIQNAIKYGREGGRVAIALTADGSRISVSVADDGIGIAPEHLPRLTERFYRVSAKDSRERGGTGLGLAIVKHIVNRHRGELRIVSTLGKGSTFTVCLPRPDTSA